MNNENNVNGMGQPVNPTAVPEPAPVTPVTPVTPEVTPVAPVAPEVTPVAPVAPEVTPVTPVTPEVAPVTPEPVIPVAPEPVAPVAPEVTTVTPEPTPETPVTPEAPATGTPATGAPVGEEPKKNNTLIIVIALLAVVVIGACLYFFVFKDKNNNGGNSGSNGGNGGNNQPVTKTEEAKFLELANKYVETVDKMWKEDKMVCQDAKDATQSLKPSELSSTDQFEGPAFYYVFIDTAASDEMKLDLTSDRQVAGWVRIGKSDGTYYVALSDGKNYVVDKGTENGVVSSSLTASDVVTTGNGNNYQYKNGEIFGSQTDGNGWGIGDAVVLSDEDPSNDGIYMSNGRKDGGYTPFCSNLTE